MVFTIGFKTFFYLGIIVVVTLFGNVHHEDFVTGKGAKGTKLGAKVSALKQMGADIGKPCVLSDIGIYKDIGHLADFADLHKVNGFLNKRGRQQYAIEFALMNQFPLVDE